MIYLNLSDRIILLFFKKTLLFFNDFWIGFSCLKSYLKDS